VSRRPASNLLSFAVAAVAMVAALGVSAVTGRPRADDVLGYLPKEADAVVATGDVRSVWRVLAEHFADTARRLDETKDVAAAPPCSLTARELDAFRGCLARIRREGLEALAANGLDIDQGIVVGIVGVDRRIPGYVAQVGVRDRARFAQWLGVLANASRAGKRVPVPAGAADASVSAYCENPTCETPIYLAFVPTGRALVTNSWLALERALANPATNRARAWDDDALMATLRDVEKPGAGRIAALVRPPTDAHFVRRLTVRVRGEAAAFTIDGELDVDAQRSRLLEAFVKPPAAPPTWSAKLERDTPAAVTLLDDEAARFVAWAARQLKDEEGGWPLVLRRIGEVSGLRALVIATTGRRATLPDFLVGAWGDAAALDEMTVHLQRDLYASRDRAVLTAALNDPRAKEEAAALDVLALVRLRVLAPEPRLRAAVVTAGALMRLTPPRVGDDRFVHAGRTITYLGPRLTRNDLELRAVFRKFRDKPVERDVLLSDRGRLAAMPMDGGLLWIATDVDALKAMAARGDGSVDPLTQGTFFPSATVRWGEADKIEVFFDIARLSARGMLAPDSGLTDAIRAPLTALRDHPALALSVSAADGRSRVTFSARLLRAEKRR